MTLFFVVFMHFHNEIYTQLDTYYNENRVPNIIFHGRNGSW